MLVVQACLTLCDPMDYNLPGFSVHGILQARTGLGCHFLLQGIFPVQGYNLGFPYCNQTWATRKFQNRIIIHLNLSIYDIYWYCHFTASNPSLCPMSNAEEAEVGRFYENLQDLLELTPKKDVLFIIGDWNAKIGSQEIPGVRGKFGFGVQNEAGQRLTEFCQENALFIATTLFQQHKRRLYTRTSPDGK